MTEFAKYALATLLLLSALLLLFLLAELIPALISQFLP
jgi:hypothetical protein